MDQVDNYPKMWIQIKGVVDYFPLYYFFIVQNWELLINTKWKRKQRTRRWVYKYKERAKFLKVRGLYTCRSNIEYTIQGLGQINPHNKTRCKDGIWMASFQFKWHTHTHQPISHEKCESHSVCYLAGQSRWWV